MQRQITARRITAEELSRRAKYEGLFADLLEKANGEGASLRELLDLLHWSTLYAIQETAKAAELDVLRNTRTWEP